MLVVIFILAVFGVFLMGCGAYVNRMAVRCQSQAGRSFLVPLGLARLLILAGLATTGMALTQACIFIGVFTNR